MEKSSTQTVICNKAAIYDGFAGIQILTVGPDVMVTMIMRILHFLPHNLASRNSAKY